jgi:hypothetical protein
MNNHCKDCVHFKKNECFRYPPTVASEVVRREYTNDVEAVTRYPSVYEDSPSCGEFTAKGAE